MSYTKHTWKDYESGGTPITAQALNEMESGIEAAHTQIASTDKKVATNEQNIQELSTNVSKAATNIAALQKDMSNAQNNIQGLTSSISALSTTVDDITSTYAKKADVPKLVKVDNTTIKQAADGTLSGAMSVDVDTSLSISSSNPIANSAVTTAINGVNTALQDKANTDTVPNLVKVDGTTITKATDGTLSAVGGGGGGTIVLPIDDTLSEESTNAVQNKVITNALQQKAGTNDIATLNKNITQLQNNKADKTEVPKLVKVDNKTVFLSEDGVLSAKGGGGSSFAPKEVTNASITNGNGKVSIKWTDPSDVTLEGVTLSTWAGTKLVMNESNYPTNENDGTVILNSTTRNQYQSTGYEVTGLTNNNTYYFALFPYSTDGIYNYSEAGRLLGKPSLVKLDPCTGMKATATMGKVTISWTDPNATKTENENTATWQKTVLVYKQGTTAPTDVNDGTIAVEEMTRNQYQSTGYEVTSLIDGNDYSFSLFAISTDSAVSDATSVSAKLYATLTVTTEEASLYGKAVTVTSDGQKVTGTFNDSGSVTLKIPWIGSTVVSSTDGTDTTTATVNIAEYGNSYNVELSFIKIVTFADGTDAEIMAMIEAHYNNKINIADYWAVGDIREIGLSAMSATYVSESHLSGTYKFAIADFDHDDLTTPINGHTKAAVTLTQVDCLMDVETRNNPTTNGQANKERGYMNNSETNYGGWEKCARRTWCNNIYYNAIIGLKDIVKTVNKKTSRGGESSTIVTTADKVFLLSDIEVMGDAKYSYPGEGTQYPYYESLANKCKLPKWNATDASGVWFLRSPYYNDSSYFMYVLTSGGPSWVTANTAYGIAPCFCI